MPGRQRDDRQPSLIVGCCTALAMAGTGCDRAPDRETVAVVAAGQQGGESGTYAHEVGFADGTTIVAVNIGSRSASPGGSVAGSIHVSGEGRGPLEIGLLPPRVEARQQVGLRRSRADGGDPRGLWVPIEDTGSVSFELELPMPWHPRSAILMARKQDADGRAVPAISGPRTSAGTAVLGLVSVTPEPVRVVAVRTNSIDVDGRLDESAWQSPAAVLVNSIDGEPDPGAATRVWFAWDPTNLYVAANLPDADIWTEYREQDDPLYKGEVFEVFLARSNDGRNYLELEVSARNVTFDARFSHYRKGDEAWDSTWTTAVEVDGTLDDRGDRDRGWRVEIAVPWAEVCEQTGVVCPPMPGTRLRANVFRLEHPTKGSARGLSLSPTRKPDFHAWENSAIIELGA